MNKGFTLVELLAVIVILAIITSIGFVGYSRFVDKPSKDYYANLETNLRLAANNYFLDHRSERPSINLTSGEYDACSDVSARTLIENHYLENIQDHQKKACNLDETMVYIKRNSDNEYEYKVLISCTSYQYLLDEDEINDYCLVSPDNSHKTILVSAIDSDMQSINVKRLSNNWTNKNITVTFDSTVKITKYEIKNSNNTMYCDTLNDYKCSMTFTEYGTYTVSSYDNNTFMDEITIYIPIDKESPTFDISLNDKYYVGNNNKASVTFSLSNTLDLSGISSINYNVLQDSNTIINKISTLQNITENLNSGVYTLKIKALDRASNESNWNEKSFKVVRKIQLIDLLDDAYNETFDVVDGYIYGYLDTLPILSKTGYTFLGWYTDPSNDDLITNNSRASSIITTLYARWEI